jgi:hypothetical protein
MNVRTIAPIIVLALGLSACAAGSRESLQAVQGGSLSEIILGFWHGMIAPLTLLSEVVDKIAPGALPWSFSFYEDRNLGVLYDVGFYVGLVAGPSVFFTGFVRRGRV